MMPAGEVLVWVLNLLDLLNTTSSSASCLAKGGRSEAEDGQGEDGETHSSGEGEVPAFLRYHYPVRGQYTAAVAPHDCVALVLKCMKLV